MSFSLDHQLYGPMPYPKARPASLSSSSGFHSQRRRPTYSHSQPQQSSSDSLGSFNGDMARRNEKQILQALNDRFAGYIDKVRNLEMLNGNLEAEAEALRQSQAARTSVGEHYDRELGDLRGLVQQLTGENARAVLEHEHLEEDIQHVRSRLEDEARNREEIEAAARAMNKYVEECGLTRLELDKKLHALQEEVAFLKKNHEEETADLLAQIQGVRLSFEVRDTTIKADITSALREIRAQLDGHATKSATQAEEWFSVRMEQLSVAARGNTDAIRGAQEEIAEYRRQLQNRTIELETIRGTKESLERQCLESENRHHGDINSLQETIHQLDNDLKSTKWEMASQLRNYQELLNVKMALDIEIAAYRKLLEGEETRFISGAGPYSYLKLKAEELSDTVIVEEQTDETQVTEVTEDAEEEEGEKDNEEGDEEEGDDTKGEAEDGEGEEEDKKEEEDGEGAEKGEEGDEEEEEKSKSPPKSPPKTLQPKSPPSKSPAKSPAVKSPADDKSKSPEAKSPITKDAPKEEKKEKEQPQPAKEEKKEKEQPQPAKEEKKEKEQPKPVSEDKKQEPKEKEKPESKAEKTDQPAIKESKTEETPKKTDTPKPAPVAQLAEDKPTPKSTPKESPAPAKKQEEKATPSKTEDKPKAEKPAPKLAAPETTESKKDEKKTEEKEEEKESPKAADNRMELKDGEKMDKKKSSGTEAKVSKDEKAKK